MNNNPKNHNRKSIRLKGYDYSQPGLYFITLCVQDRINLFGEIKDGQLELNNYGMIAKEEWKKTKAIRKNCSLKTFVVMPNHFHAIVSIDYQIGNNNKPRTFQSPSQTIGAIIRGFKGATTKRIKEYFRRGELQFDPTTPNQFLKIKMSKKKSIWQRNYWVHIIRNEKSYHTIVEYIENNPANWLQDKLYQQKI
jgi:REP element-mobilizing transposase RayT